MLASFFQTIGNFIAYTNGLYFFKTNLFNFIIFAGIIIFLFYKLNVTSKLEQAKDSVK